MQHTLTASQKAMLAELSARYPIISQATQRIVAEGGTAYLVGGAVRDIFMQRPISDADIEVHGISFDTLQKILEEYGRVDYVGKSFGVLRIAHVPLDWSLPRRDSAGRKPQVELDQNLPLTEALRRRDVTMNALALNLTTQICEDPFNGVRDIEQRVLRATDAQLFQEDPLRLYRVMQFIGRFEMEPDTTLNDICTTMDVTSVSRERIEKECEKLLLQSRQPSRGFRWLEKLGRLLELFPELGATIGILQPMNWHPEGDVFEHSMQAVDAAVALEYPNEHVRKLIIYAALCHDLGKPVATRIEDGRIRSIGHDDAGAPIARSFLQRFVGEKDFIKAVSLLVKYHMMPGNFVTNNAGASAYKKLAIKCAPLVSLEYLYLLMYADKRARNPLRGTPLTNILPDAETFKERAQKYGVWHAPEASIVTAEDLLPFCEPGPRLGKLLQEAYAMQIEEDLRDKVILLQRILPRK